MVEEKTLELVLVVSVMIEDEGMKRGLQIESSGNGFLRRLSLRRGSPTRAMAG